MVGGVGGSGGGMLGEVSEAEDAWAEVPVLTVRATVLAFVAVEDVDAAAELRRAAEIGKAVRPASSISRCSSDSSSSRREALGRLGVERDP
jgi:hypothetical protein